MPAVGSWLGTTSIAVLPLRVRPSEVTAVRLMLCGPGVVNVCCRIGTAPSATPSTVHSGSPITASCACRVGQVGVRR